MPVTLNNNSDFINSTDYKKLENKLLDLKSILDDNTDKNVAARKLRYAEVDIEVEREASRLAPDELYVPQHIIDTNIRREQSCYIQYITQSPRAVILEDQDDETFDLSVLEKDLTKKLRYDGWQLPMYANIDAFQANGYSIIETVYDKTVPGNISREAVQYGDFAFIADTRDIQAVEMTARTYHYTMTRLVDLATPKPGQNPDDVWSKEQVEKIIGQASSANEADPGDSTDSKDHSLYRVQKVMFRVNGIVHVAWACINVCDGWLRAPRPLYVGRREIIPPQVQQISPLGIPQQQPQGPPQSKEAYETEYPYFLYPYLISENDTISHLKGRVYLDQDVQEAVSSLISSTVTQARRAAGLYFSKDVADPNDDLLLQKNVFFKTGCLINSKVASFKLDAPDPGMFSAIQMLVATNLNETSQVNFAESNNQKDSRKTATAIKASMQQQQTLSNVQVVLFSIALKSQFTYEVEIIRSRVLAGLIIVNQQLQQMYARNFIVKPSGDTDVIERQQMIQTMMSAWPVIQNTPAAMVFLSDLLEKMFPDTYLKYVTTFQQAQQQQQSQQTQQIQQMTQMLVGLSKGIIDLSKKPEMFSETGKIHALPVLEGAAQQLEQMGKQVKENHKQ